MPYASAPQRAYPSNSTESGTFPAAVPVRSSRRGRHVFLATVLTGLLMATLLPTPVAASTATSMQTSILTWINHDRAARGLRPLRLDVRLRTVASDRATAMASAGVLSHTIAGNLPTTLTNRGIQYWSLGEAVGYDTYAWGTTSAWALFRLWKASPAHWALLMSSKFNYVGVGVAYRSANHATYGSVVLTESVDHTRPVSHMIKATRSGTTVTWYWTGHDPLLQTHTAGLRGFDVDYRIGSGTWRVIRTNTTARYLRLTGRSHGHAYSIRVRSRDRRGLVSAWSAAIRVWIP